MSNEFLRNAKEAKKDEFYTQLETIEKEMGVYLEHDPNFLRGKTLLLPCDKFGSSKFIDFFTDNFRPLGLKKIIATHFEDGGQGQKIEVVEKDGTVEITLELLEGDGDFASQEVTALRDKADAIIINPPFSLFREFLPWAMKDGKIVSVIGNMNAATYRDVFPLIHDEKLWLGRSISGGDVMFEIPDDYPVTTASGSQINDEGKRVIRVPSVRWYTNIPGGKPERPLDLMTMRENRENSRKKKIREEGYPKHDNFDAIEVSFTEAIPSDYPGVMAVPITYLDKHDPRRDSRYSGSPLPLVALRSGRRGQKWTRK